LTVSSQREQTSLNRMTGHLLHSPHLVAHRVGSPITDLPDSRGSGSYWWQGDYFSSDVVGGEGGRSAVWQESGGRLACYTHKKEVKAENCAIRRLWLHVDAHMQQL